MQERITLADYWMGRDVEYSLALSTDIRAKAARTVLILNMFLEDAVNAGVTLERNPRTGSLLSSGWRPPAVNSATPGAAFNSKHMTGEAGDVFDPDGDLDEWCMSPAGVEAMVKHGLWLEHPSATKGWCHLQIVPPRSGNRVFYP